MYWHFLLTFHRTKLSFLIGSWVVSNFVLFVFVHSISIFGDSDFVHDLC